MHEMNRKKRPTGVVLIAIYTGFGAVISLLIGVPQLLLKESTAASLILGGVFSSFGFLFLATVLGLWSLKAWGYKLARAIYVLSVAFGFIGLFSNAGAKNTATQAITVVIALWILAYLNKEGPKALFAVES